MLIRIKIVHSHSAGTTNISEHTLFEMFEEDFTRRFGMVFRISKVRYLTVVYTLGRICKDSNDARVLQLAVTRISLKLDVLI